MANVTDFLPLGKLPPALLERLIHPLPESESPPQDPRVILGPGIGLDCAVVDAGQSLFVFKAEPITFATDEIGWYGVQIAANDIATTGAKPLWYLATLLLPERRTTPALVEAIGRQAHAACREIGITIIGGHTEITYGLDRPLLIGTLIGEVSRENLITPRGTRPNDRLLLTKGVPVEATAILAREFPEKLRGTFSDAEIQRARDFLFSPGVSVLRDAQIATAAGQVHAMHDPTEGGLAAALWELAKAGDVSLVFHPEKVHIPELSARLCALFDLDPLATIASGALLMAVAPQDSAIIQTALEAEGIACAEIGSVEAGPAQVWTETPTDRVLLTWPPRDEITRVYE